MPARGHPFTVCPNPRLITHTHTQYGQLHPPEPYICAAQFVLDNVLHARIHTADQLDSQLSEVAGLLADAEGAGPFRVRRSGTLESRLRASATSRRSPCACR